MDRETLTAAIKRGHVRILMDDGQIHNIDTPEDTLADDKSAHILYQDNDGKVRTKWLPLNEISRVVPIAD